MIPPQSPFDPVFADPGATDPETNGRRPLRSLSLGDPSGVFRALDSLLSPLRLLRHLVPPLALITGYAMYQNQFDLLAQVDRLAGQLAFWQSLLITMITTNLLSKVARGITLAHFGADSRNWGIKLAYGIIPRFYIDSRKVQQLGPAAQRAYYASSPTLRLMMFVGGILGWLILYRTGSGLALILLTLGMGGLGSFLFVANPLLPLDGYNWLSVVLKRPYLRTHAFRLLGMVVTLRPLPADLRWGEFWVLLLYAIVSLVFTAFLLYSVFSAIAYSLAAQFHGTGVAIFCLILAAVGLFLLSMSEKRAGRGAGEGARRGRTPRPQAARMAGATLIRRDKDRGQEQGDDMARRARAGFETAKGSAGAGRQADQDALALLLADEDLWAESAETSPEPDLGPDVAPEAGARPAPAPLGRDAGLDDILALPPEPEAEIEGARDEIAQDELDDILSLAFGIDPEPQIDPQTDPQPAPQTAPQAPPEAPLAADPAPRPAAITPDLDDIFAPGSPAEPEPRPQPRARRPEARSESRAEPRRAEADDLDRVLKMGAAQATPWQKWRARLLWVLVLGGLIYVAFLPYPYEVGGDFLISSVQRAEARSRTDGEIISVHVTEGAWVKEGDILAVLSNWDEKRDVAINEADAAKLEADLATMVEGAKPEEIRVASERLAATELGVSVAKQDLARQEALFASGTITQKLVEDARNALKLAETAREEARARLDLVASGARDTEVDAQRAAIARNAEELAFARLMLEYSNIRAPAAGQIVSSLAGVPVGAYLPQGALFAEIEDNRVVIAEVEVPETSIQDVTVGAKAELRLWSAPDTSLFGTVRSIAPRAEERDFGKIIRVEVEVPNPDGRLAANMTGFGKVQAAERPVWQAFSGAIVGFFSIELWSWLP